MGVLDASTSPPKERYAVPNDNVIKLIQPGIFDDQLTEILRNGARALLAKAVEAEVADFLGKHADLKTQDGQQRVKFVRAIVDTFTRETKKQQLPRSKQVVQYAPSRPREFHPEPLTDPDLILSHHPARAID